MLSAVEGESEIVGREEELADIASAVWALHSGEGGFRAYVGDPGIGKTRMLLALATAAREAGVATLWDQSGRVETLIDFVLATQARGGGAVVVMDDVHGHGDAVVEGLGRLLDLTARGPLLLAIAYRPRQLPLSMAGLLCRAPARLGARKLAPLTLDQTKLLVGDRPDLAMLHHDAEGVPLYARVLADAGYSSSAPLLAELATLPPSEFAVAQAAAILDHPFVPETVIAVCDLEAEATRAALDGLVSLDIIRTSRPGPLLSFRHRTLAAAAYHTTPMSRRGALHLRADRELERRGAPAIMRAAHVANSLDPARPDRYVTLALGARQALSTDPAAATGWLEVAEAGLGRDHPHWRETQLLLAKARLHMGRLDDSRTTFLSLEDIDAVMHTGRIERFLGRYPEAAALIQAGLTRNGSPDTRSVGLVELSAIAADCSDHADSDRLATEAARIARAAGDPLRECVALGSAAWARTALGDVAGGGAAVLAAARLADSMVDAVVVQDIDCLRLLGQSELLLDRLADARRHLGRGVRLARRTGQRHILPNLLKSLTELELRLGRLDRAGQVLDEAEPLAAETGVIVIQTLLAALRMHVLLWQRPVAEVGLSVAAGERATGLAAGANSVLTWPLQAQVALGEALVHAGQPGHGGQILLTAGGGPLLPKVSPQKRVRWWEILAVAAVGESDLARADEYATLAVRAVGQAPTDIRRGFAFRARAYVDSARGATAAALAAGEEAVSSFAKAGALLELGRAQVLVASAFIDAGRLEDVADRLAMAGALARRCHSGRLVEMVRAQLARLPAHAPRRDWLSVLTPRERDIASLAGQAMPSTEIAAKLHLSVRTVDSHLGRIYRKLGVANRVALANLLNAGAPRSGGEV